MANKKKNKRKIAIAAGVTSVALILTGTFAWFSTTDAVKNIFGLDNFDVHINEDFDPNVPNIVPGADITKDVTVANGGNVDVVVRVKLNESLKVLEMDKANGTDKVKTLWADKAVDLSNPGDPKGLVDTGAAIYAKMNPELLTSYIGTPEKQGPYKLYSEGTTVKLAGGPAGAIKLNEVKAGQTTAIGTDAVNGIKIYQKTANGGVGTNTVYSYVAVRDITLDDGTHEYQLLQVTPTKWEGDGKAKPTEFTVKYGYHQWKNGGVATEGNFNPITDKTTATALDKLIGGDGASAGTFHDKTVKLFFGDNVQTDGQALNQNTVWYLAKDGYFYYCKPLEGGKITESLLKSVKISENAGNALRGGQYILTPVMEAVQKEHGAVIEHWTDLSTYNGKSAVAPVNTDQEQLVYNVVAQNKAHA